MSAIRYVCLSDLHFGQRDGLLTNLNADLTEIDVTQPSAVLRALCEGLRALLAENPADAPPPTLILNGDILETAFTTLNQAAMAFERFVELAFPEPHQGAPLFGRVIYVPGNHDHHLWEMARETQYVNHMLRSHAGATELDVPWHTTNMLVEHDEHPLTSYFLNNLFHRHGHKHLEGLELEVAYPNFGLHRESLSRAVIFHHGHFVEPLYHLLSLAAEALFDKYTPPELVYDVEAENFAWIDFFWGCLGRSGSVGPLVEQVYDSLGYEAARNQILSHLARHLAAQWDFFPGDRVESAILTKILEKLADRIVAHERRAESADGPVRSIPLSATCQQGLERYLSGPARLQLLMEMGDAPPPDDVTFVFGHTHKPYQYLQQVDEFDRPVPIFNTGGWVVESEKPSPTHGATATLLDDDLNAVALHLYAENDFDVRIVDADPDHAEDNPLGGHARKALAATRQTWRDFADTTAAQVKARAAAIARRQAEHG